MKRTCALFILSLLVSSLATWSVAAATELQTGRPAEWRPHDIIVDLHNLPQRYSCDDLWYKFRDVLLAIGARPDVKILAYRCGPQRGDLAYSPSVHLQFSIPALLDPAHARWADIDAAPQTIRLTPGQPGSLHDSDCELMRQIKDGLLAALPEKIVSFNLACAAPPSRRWPFSVTVQALASVNTNPRVAAQIGAPTTLPKRIF